MSRNTAVPGAPEPVAEGVADAQEPHPKPFPPPLTRAQRDAMRANIQRLRELDERERLRRGRRAKDA